MSSRFDNKKLLYLLAGLIIVLLLTFIKKIPAENATLKSSIVEIDTAEVSRILIESKPNKGNPIDFNRSGAKWTVSEGSIVSPVKEGVIANMFGEVLKMKPISLASKDRSKWDDFEVSDSLGTRVKLLNGKGNILADLMVGKFTYKQVQNPYGGNSVDGTSFVRIYDENEIYAVPGFLQFTFAGTFNDWRDKSFIQVDKNNITDIRFIYPADSSFKLTRNGTKWDIENQIADSAKVAEFVNSLSRLDGQKIMDNFTPDTNPAYQLAVEGNNLTSLTVKCYKGESENEYILNSSQNPDIYFSSEISGLFEKLFKSGNFFREQ